jgi:hypothetical protein
MNGVGIPFELPSDIIYFTDWRYIDHGYLRWLTAENEPVSIMPAPNPLPAMHTSSEWLPKGIRIETIPGTVDPEPTLTATELGEKLFFGGSIINDNGNYRLFYESITGSNPNHDKVLRTAESDDGINWRFPNIGKIDITGAKYNNAVLHPGFSGYHGGCVFMDKTGDKNELYKSIWLGLLNREKFERYIQQWPYDIDPMAVFKNKHPDFPEDAMAWGIFGAVSPDGYEWKVLDDPLIIQHSDTFNAATFDHVTGQYIIYPRTWYYGRRSVGRLVSDDFRHFSNLQQVLCPDPSMQATDTWYTPGYVTIPGTTDYHLMFATLWSQIDDTFTPILHTSMDGVLWQRIPGKPMLQHGPTGSWYACGGALPSLVELPNNQWGSFMMGWHVPHKYPRSFPGFGQAGWVRWTRGRLAALRADEDASFNLFPIKTNKRKMIINYSTKKSGYIKIGVNGKEPLRVITDADIIIGDDIDRIVTWNGNSDMGNSPDEGIQIQVEMRNADLYSIRFE